MRQTPPSTVAASFNENKSPYALPAAANSNIPNDAASQYTLILAAISHAAAQAGVDSPCMASALSLTITFPPSSNPNSPTSNPNNIVIPPNPRKTTTYSIFGQQFFNENCISCRGNHGNAGVNLTTLAGITSNQASITAQIESGTMPIGATLTAPARNAILA